MKTQLRNFLILLSIVVFSCKEKTNKTTSEIADYETIMIPKSRVAQKEALNIKEIIDHTRLIKLETTDESIIGSIQDIKIYDDHIYILDITKSKGLFKFAMDGKFIKKYGNLGKGPGEYMVPMAFDIDPKNKEIIIYDRAKRTLLKYSFDGDFKEATATTINATNFVSTHNSNSYIFDTHLQRQNKGLKQYGITQIDAENAVVAEYLETNKNQNKLAFLCVNSLYKNEDLIAFNKPFDNIIYKLDKGSIHKMFQFEFSGKTITPEIKKDVSYQDFVSKIAAENHEYLNGNAGFFLVENKVLFTINRGASREDYIYNLKTKKTNLLKPIYKGGDLALFGMKKCTYKNSIVSYAETMWYLNTELYNSEDYANTPVQNLIKQTKKGDNPIIIITTIKQ